MRSSYNIFGFLFENSRNHSEIISFRTFFKDLKNLSKLKSLSPLLCWLQPRRLLSSSPLLCLSECASKPLNNRVICSKSKVCFDLNSVTCSKSKLCFDFESKFSVVLNFLTKCQILSFLTRKDNFRKIVPSGAATTESLPDLCRFQMNPDLKSLVKFLVSLLGQMTDFAADIFCPVTLDQSGV